MNTNNRDQAQSLRELVSQNATRRRALKIATIASGKGGVGKSSLCVNIAIALSSLGYRVLVVDADFGLANIDVMLGVNSKYNMGHLLRRERTIGEIIQEGYNGIRFISGGSGVFELLQMDEINLRRIMRDLRGLNDPADVILFDAGAGINDHLLQLIDASSEAIIVTTPEPTAFVDAYALIKTLVGSDSGGSRPNLRLIMNKCESRKEAQTAVEGFVKVIKRHLSLDIAVLGYILYDHDIIDSIKSQTPVMISNPTGATSKNILDITRKLMDIPIDESGPVKRISRLFERLLGG